MERQQELTHIYDHFCYLFLQHLQWITWTITLPDTVRGHTPIRSIILERHSTALSLSRMEWRKLCTLQPSSIYCFNNLFNAALAEFATVTSDWLYLGKAKAHSELACTTLSAAHIATPTRGTSRSLEQIFRPRHAAGRVRNQRHTNRIWLQYASSLAAVILACAKVRNLKLDSGRSLNVKATLSGYYL